MIGDYLPETSAPDPVAETTAVLDERLEQTQIAAEALRDLEQEAEEARGPLVVESFSVAELMQMSPEDRAAALAEFEEQAALAATASGELVEAGLGELGEDDQTETDLGELDDLDDGDEPEFDHVDADVDDEGDEQHDLVDSDIRVAELEGELAALRAVTEPSVFDASQLGRQYEIRRLNATFHAAIDHHLEQGCSPQAAELLRSASWVDVIGLAVEALESRGGGQRTRTAQPSRRSPPGPPAQRAPAERASPVRISAPEMPHTVSDRPARRSADRRAGRALPAYAFDADGSPSERFEREVKAGLWLGADL